MAGALWIARLLHIAMIAVPGAAGRLHLGSELELGRHRGRRRLLLYEHSLVKADDLSRVDAAFFTVNGYVSVLFFLFWAATSILRSLRA